MITPDHLQSVAGEVLGLESIAAQRQSLWATVFKLVPYLDGNSWCVLLGDDIQVGICGFGDTPATAIFAFEDAMHKAQEK